MQNAEFDRLVADDVRHVIALLNDLLEGAAKAGVRCEVDLERHQQFASGIDLVTVGARIWREVK